ncbi:hypothetical protein AT15_03780 [Kosmotoga arenicorallina S304]|uniref:ATPase domain-containing protein n=1 Tax=Kosmotoga arenicorallina S304 TaxID=1453497 RepID=A0A182C841_9BACT|nr:ATP-binding protein [Kosmotoga arenicorallina]OAA31954.1 hypothetical protein AT15_03780 [Kosmotoga arenicorallina S304]
MLFSIEPKHSLRDIFNRKEEVSAFQKSLQSERLIVLDGLRRIGKTSLLKAVLEEFDGYHVFIDCRAYFRNNLIDVEAFDRALIKEIEKTLKLGKLKKILKSISGLSFGGFEISIEGKGQKTNLAEALKSIDETLKGKRFVLAFDEAQNLRFYRKGGKDLLNLFAYIYDNLKNFVIVLTGSEIGLLHDFLGIDDPDAPLFGRYLSEIRLQRFSKDKSLEFLRKGFEELAIDVSEKSLERVVDELDGIVGYLSIYGYIYYKEDPVNALEKTKELAKKLVEKELSALINRSTNYGYVLKAVSLHINRFNQIRTYIENNFGTISDPTLSKILNTLVKQSFLEQKYVDGVKRYLFPDPVMEYVCKEMRMK